MSRDGYFLVRRGSTAVSNKLIHDKSLSYATLGVLMACLAMPDEAVKGYRQLTGRGLGEHATRRALRELEDHHLRFRFRVRSGGRLRDVVIVSDAPIEVDEAMGIVVAAMKDGTMTSGPTRVLLPAGAVLCPHSCRARRARACRRGKGRPARRRRRTRRARGWPGRAKNGR